MDFTLPEHVEALREEVRRFAQKEIRPHVMDWDESRTFPMEVMGQLGEMGMMGVLFPEEYGGRRHGLPGVRGGGGGAVPGGRQRRAQRRRPQQPVLQPHLYPGRRAPAAALPQAPGQRPGAWAPGRSPSPAPAATPGPCAPPPAARATRWVLNGTKNFATHGTVGGHRRGHGPHPHRAGHRRHQRLHPGEGHARLPRRKAGEQAGHARQRHLRTDPGGGGGARRRTCWARRASASARP